MLGISRTEYRTNESILRELGIKHRLSSTVHASILAFFGHVSRRSGESIERLVFQSKVEGIWPRSRSPTRWTDLSIWSAVNGPPHECTRKSAVRVVRYEYCIVQVASHSETGYKPQQDHHDHSDKSITSKGRNSIQIVEDYNY